MPHKSIATGIGRDNEKIELSEAQSNPRLAEPSDFIVEDGGADRATPFHGQHGDTAAEYKKLTRADRDKGKRPASTTLDRLGRRLVK
jgi:hypothetical protein